MDKLKPQLKTRNVPLLQGIAGVSLSRIAEEALLKDAWMDSEGEVDIDGSNIVYRGSTLLTIELERPSFGLVYTDAETFLRAIKHSLRLRVRLMRMARREAERRSEPKLLTGMFIETEFKIEDTKLLVDINVECPLELPRALDGRSKEGLV